MGRAPPRPGQCPRDRGRVGAAINLPGPFYLLALGDIASGGYSTPRRSLIVLFNAIMFLLVEVPLVGYLLRPEKPPGG